MPNWRYSSRIVYRTDRLHAGMLFYRQGGQQLAPLPPKIILLYLHHNSAFTQNLGLTQGFWGILKSEMYYLRKFTDEQELISAIEKYIHFYNTKRYQTRLRCMTPMEFHAAA